MSVLGLVEKERFGRHEARSWSVQCSFLIFSAVSNVGNPIFLHIWHMSSMRLQSSQHYLSVLPLSTATNPAPWWWSSSTNAVELYRGCLAPLSRDVRGCGDLSSACFVNVSKDG